MGMAFSQQTGWRKLSQVHPRDARTHVRVALTKYNSATPKVSSNLQIFNSICDSKSNYRKQDKGTNY